MSLFLYRVGTVEVEQACPNFCKGNARIKAYILARGRFCLRSGILPPLMPQSVCA